MKKVTVLGGLGYIGSHLVNLLVESGFEVKILDLALFGKDHINTDNVEIIIGDIRHADSLSKAIKDTDIVIHLAGLVGDPACSIDEEETWLHNVESSSMLADMCNYYKVKKLIFASSCSVYGASPSDVILNEGSYLNPISLYAQTKIESEHIFSKEIHNELNVIRLATVFGHSPRMRFDLIANLFTIRAIKTKKINVFGGTQYRPFIHCFDAARAFHDLACNTRPFDREVFNVSVQNISILELGKLVESLIPETKVEIVTTKEDDRNYRVSSEKIKWLLNYQPLYSITDGLLELKDMCQGYEDWEQNKKYYNS